VSVSWFHKEIKDYIVTGTNAGTVATGNDNGFNGDFGGFTILQSANAGTAVVQGWEVAYQQQFTFLPGWLKGLGASANYTLIDTHGNFGGTTSRGTNEVPGFIPRTGNASLSWRHRKLSARVLYNYVGSYITSFNAATPGYNAYRYRYETVTVGMAWQHRPSLQFTVDVANLFNEPIRNYRGFADRMSNTIINGTSITFGINGRF
jgi:TonB-dependent receptor